MGFKHEGKKKERPLVVRTDLRRGLLDFFSNVKKTSVHSFCFFAFVCVHALSFQYQPYTRVKHNQSLFFF